MIDKVTLKFRDCQLILDDKYWPPARYELTPARLHPATIELEGGTRMRRAHRLCALCENDTAINWVIPGTNQRAASNNAPPSRLHSRVSTIGQARRELVFQEV